MRKVAQGAVLAMRKQRRTEMACQIVHDSIHRRPGWTECFVLSIGKETAGFGSVAVAGPWKGKPTVFEFYVVPKFRGRAFELFEAFLKGSGAKFFEVQSNDSLLAVMVHTHGRGVTSEKIVFADGLETKLGGHGAVVESATPPKEVRKAMKERQGGGEWLLIWQGETIGKGGILFHYNAPYADIYMEIAEGHRRRGFGGFLVQELKRICHGLGAIPCARCSPENVASRRTLQKAGFVPFAHILIGEAAGGVK